MKNIKIKLEDLTCPSCIKKIETVLSKEHGITEARVLFNSSQVKVSFNPQEITEENIENIIEGLGYPIKQKVRGL